MRLEINDSGLAELLSSTAAEVFLSNIGEHVAREWKRNDPRNEPGGHDAPDISVTIDHAHGVAVANVSTPDSLWHIIEFGSINNPPYRPATKSAENAGLRLKDGDR